MEGKTVPISTAYLIYLDINTAEARKDSFQNAMDEAQHSADVCVSLNGEEKEFTLEEFGKLLGFEEVDEK